MSVLIALIVAAALYGVVFERERLFGPSETTDAVPPAPTAQPETSEARRVSVVSRASEARRVDRAVTLRGQTEASRSVDVRAETSGKVASEPIRRGAEVEAGQVLCSLEPGTRPASLREAEARRVEAQNRAPEARARLAEAEARLREAEINANAANRLGEGGYASETRIANARSQVEAARAAVEAARVGLDQAGAGVESAEAAVTSAETEITRLEITAPFAGVLETDTAEVGALLQPGGHCATVIQLNPMKLTGFVPEIDVDRISVGAPVTARLASGREVDGEVTFLSRSADPATRTFRVEAEVDNADAMIRDGQSAEIRIASAGDTAHLIAQSSLTLDDDGRLGVRLVEDGTARFAPVSILRDTAEGVFVTGLPERAEIIVVGQEYVTDGVPVDAHAAPDDALAAADVPPELQPAAGETTP